MEYVKETESPLAFNLWSGISALASSLKKNVYIKRGFYDVYPNQYIVLVGPPGVGKGTAINPAIDLVTEAGTANYLQDKITAERIVERLHQGFAHVGTGQSATGTPTVTFSVADSTATIVQTELPILLQGSEWVLPLLCELWEKGKFSYQTKTKGNLEAKGLCVSLIAGCVPNFISKLNRDATEAVTGGFTSRCIFVYESQKSQSIPWPSPNGNNKLHDDLIEDLKYISNLKGPFKFSQKGRALWETYYNSNSFKADQFDSEMLAGFKARMSSHVIKAAMVLSVSSGDDLVLHHKHLFNAMQLIGAIKSKVDITFRSVGESQLAVAQDRIMRYIESKGLTTRQEILRANFRHITDDDLTRVLYILTKAGFVSEAAKSGKVYYEHVDQRKTKGSVTP